MVRQREVLQDMVGSRTRSVLVLERNMAIRELLGKRGRAAWARRIFDAVYRAWKDIYVKVIPDPEPNRNPAPISNPNIYVKVCSKSVKVCSKSSLPPCFLTHCLSYYVKGKAQRVAAGHQLHVRERVERSMREARQPHAQNPHPQHTTQFCKLQHCNSDTTIVAGLHCCNVALLQTFESRLVPPSPSIHLCAPSPTPLTRTRSGSSTACSLPS